MRNEVPVDMNRPSPNPGPGMTRAQYDRLVARNGRQLVTDEGIAELQAKVRRIRPRG